MSIRCDCVCEGLSEVVRICEKSFSEGSEENFLDLKILILLGDFRAEIKILVRNQQKPIEVFLIKVYRMFLSSSRKEKEKEEKILL